MSQAEGEGFMYPAWLKEMETFATQAISLPSNKSTAKKQSVTK